MEFIKPNLNEKNYKVVHQTVLMLSLFVYLTENIEYFEATPRFLSLAGGQISHRPARVSTKSFIVIIQQTRTKTSPSRMCLVRIYYVCLTSVNKTEIYIWFMRLIQDMGYDHLKQQQNVILS